MSRGEHPQRTPFYGAALMIGVMVAAYFTATSGVGAAVRIPVYAICVVVGIVGGVLTYRDYSH